VLDCLAGYLLLGEKQWADKTLEGAYNFGPDDGSCVSTGKLTDLFCACWGPGASWETQGDGGPHEATFLKLDCSKAKAVLGWQPRWDIHKAVERPGAFAQAAPGGDRLACLEAQIKEYFEDETNHV
jgi:CDP-glucose 4,6-dehydratase